MQGWISIHRQVKDHWLWKDKPFSKGQAWIDLLLKASHKNSKFPLGNDLVEIERGSLITSEIKLMERWGWSKTKVRSFLKLLEQDNMIVKKSDKKKTTINICNYNDYQITETTEEPQKNQEETTEEPQKNTFNNVNNVNNENKEDVIEEGALKSIIQFYEKNGFGTISPVTVEDITTWFKKFDEPEQIIIKALEIAVKQNARRWVYVEKVLQRWSQQNLKSLSQVNAFLEQYNQKRQKHQPKKDIQKQKVPDYIQKQNEKYHQEQSQQADPDKQARINQLLKELGEV